MCPGISNTDIFRLVTSWQEYMAKLTIYLMAREKKQKKDRDQISAILRTKPLTHGIWTFNIQIIARFYIYTPHFP
jgi:hypothetical protein